MDTNINIFLNTNYTIEKYTKDQVIFHENEEINEIGIIIEGQVKISSYTLDGFIFEIAELNNGDIFGDSLAIQNKNIVPGSIVTTKDSRILFMSFKEFIKLLKINEDFLMKYLKYQSKRNIEQQYKIKLLGQPSIREKIMFYIKEEKNKTKSNTIFFGKTKEELAIMMGLNRPSLSRELIRMRNEGIILFDKKSITLL